jgi:hypothetical protein
MYIKTLIVSREFAQLFFQRVDVQIMLALFFFFFFAFFCVIMKLFIILLVHVNKSRTRAMRPSVSLLKLA